MKQFFLIFLSLTLFFFVECGEKGKNEPKQEALSNDNQKEEDNKDSDNKDDFTESMKNFTDMMKGGEKVEPVDFRKLKEFLPEEVEDMKRSSATGEKTSSFGIKVSEAVGEYGSDEGNQSITITITDLGSIKGVAGMAAFAWAYADIDKETETGYEKTTKYYGYKAYEQYDTEYKDGSIEVLVGDRFMVKVEGNDVPMETIKSAVEEIDLDGIEDMKDEGKE